LAAAIFGEKTQSKVKNETTLQNNQNLVIFGKIPQKF
jgi:hypothetical protein